MKGAFWRAFYGLYYRAQWWWGASVWLWLLEPVIMRFDPNEEWRRWYCQEKELILNA